ncbi:hypothetical protein G7067_03160 [Leucobacter insecticola]|uniref:CBU-0592-like domain-containing protein n=1 Tax=Leucobacter insecticola TaxID=2714934 RepID=A0A6G8FGP7_9MICO|nr:hypothetical protein [Leucobacter insecticola]QIM15640.1 hypothetical protein G7067_03160 [Leucobacter insecticola]
MDTLIGSILGWVGTIGTFSAYVLLWRGRVDSSALHYSLLNAAGGFMAGAGAFAFGAWPAFGSNIVWGAIGVHGVVMALRRKLAASAALTSAAAPHPLVAGPWTPDTTDALPISLPWLPRVIEMETPEAVQTQSPAEIPAPAQTGVTPPAIRERAYAR